MVRKIINEKDLDLMERTKISVMKEVLGIGYVDIKREAHTERIIEKILETIDKIWKEQIIENEENRIKALDFILDRAAVYDVILEDLNLTK